MSGSPDNTVQALTARVEEVFAPGPRIEIGSTQELAALAETGKLGAFEAKSLYAACLSPLLTALGWRGDLRDIAEALPHAAELTDGAGLQNVLANLRLSTRRLTLPTAQIDERAFPCVFASAEDRVFVLLARTGAGLHVFDAQQGCESDIAEDPRQGTAYLVLPQEPSEAAEPHSQGRFRLGWIGGVLGRFRPVFTQLLLVSLASNIVTLGTTLFTMAIYDRIIPGRSALSLVFLLIGMIGLLAFDVVMRLLRGRALAHIATRIDVIIGRETLQKILRLPASFTERAPIGGQIARIKEFEALREFFTGPLAAVFLDLPFVLLFVLVIALIAGPLALIPVVMVAAFLVLGFVLLPALRRAMAAASQARSERHNFIVEALTNARAIKQASAEPVWQERYRTLSGRLALTNFRAAQFSNLFQVIPHVIMMSAGIATLGFGVGQVLEGTLTVGALVAAMALVWRVLSPLQAGFLTLTRLEQIMASVDQINRLMAMHQEDKSQFQTQQRRRFSGHLTFQRVSLRYQANAQPALLGADFDIAAGSLVAIAGSNGSGKSTILKLAAGLVLPQAGAIALDGLDIRQLSASDLRKTMSYLPQSLDFFHGTIAQNLRLSVPTASDEELADVARRLGVLDEILALPEGFETRFGDQSIQRLPTGFRQRLALARTFLRKAPVYLLDEPANGLDGAGDAAFVALLQRLRGTATILMVTHRPSHMKLADRVLLLDRGAIVKDGAPARIFAPNAGGRDEVPHRHAV